MVQEDKSVPLQAAPTGVNRFTSGITAMVLDGPWSLNTFLSDPEFKDKFGVAPLPQKKTTGDRSRRRRRCGIQQHEVPAGSVRLSRSPDLLRFCTDLLGELDHHSAAAGV